MEKFKEKFKIKGFGDIEFEPGSIGKRFEDDSIKEAERNRRVLKEGTGDAAMKEREAVFMKALGIDLRKLKEKAKDGEDIKADDLKKMKERIERMETYLTIKEGDYSDLSPQGYRSLYETLAARNGFPPKAADAFQMFLRAGLIKPNFAAN